jgi:hypothetical protein
MEVGPNRKVLHGLADIALLTNELINTCKSESRVSRVACLLCDAFSRVKSNTGMKQTQCGNFFISKLRH